MRRVFWRFITSKWGTLLAWGIIVVGLPGTFQDAIFLGKWLSSAPTLVVWGVWACGIVWAVVNLYANRNALAGFAARLRSAAGFALDGWRRTKRPPRLAAWADLHRDEVPQDNRWRVLGHTLRKVGLVAGEGRPVLIGMAAVKEKHGNRRLFLSAFVNESGKPHFEFRIESQARVALRRHAIVEVDGHLLSETTFEPCVTPAVSDARRRECLREGAFGLLEVGEEMSVSVTDTIVAGSSSYEETHDLLLAPLAGFGTAHAKLQAIARGVQAASVGM